VGSALASSIRGDGRVTVAFFGDGATEEGHFHESLNLAALYKLPVLFACENNLYSSHMSLHERRLKDNIPESATAHGIPSDRVDGNDVEAVYHSTTRAVQRAREGGGPTLLELRTFRWRGHVGPAWDMDVGVKRKDELQEWLLRDPIARCAEALVQRGVSSAELHSIRDRVQKEIENAVEFARQSPSPEENSINHHVVCAA
jgi:pyruvate dehydrogenase E1 component alpha subunit